MLKRKKNLCSYSSRHLRRLIKRHTNDPVWEITECHPQEENLATFSIPSTDNVKDTKSFQQYLSSVPVVDYILSENSLSSHSSQDMPTNSFNIEEVKFHSFSESGSSSSPSFPNIELNISNVFPNTSQNSCVTDNNIQSLLMNWALMHKITHSAFGSLIQILKMHPCHSYLPNDPRTLLKTPRNSTLRSVPPGLYYHFGVENEINMYIKRTNFNVDPSKGIELVINIDGLPISKSSTNAFWPILASLFGSRNVFMVGLYYGQSKPADCVTYLDDFVEECNTLTKNGIVINDRKYLFCIYLIVCDAPAKCLILCTKSHGGYSSCPKCYTEGEYINNRVCFPSTDANLRSDEEFLNHTDEDYHMSKSPLEKIPGIRLVSNVPFDYMHVVCLGVVKKLITLWLKGPLSIRIGHTKTKLISNQLTNLGKISVPKEFCRKPRSLEFLPNWKATELRQFLLYSGPVVLKNILDEDIYDNFVTLHAAIRILCCKSLLSQFAEYSQELLKHFVNCFSILYGKHLISHNVHALLHLPNDAKNFGVLDEFSAFKFENFMQVLKGQLRKSEKPLQQIIRRYFEMQNRPLKPSKIIVNSFEIVDNSLHYNGPLPANCEGPQYSAVRFKEFYINSLSQVDNICGIQGGKIVRIRNIAQCFITKELMVVGNEFTLKGNLYVKPCSSSLLNIYVIDPCQEQPLNIWPLKDVNCKYMKIPMSSTNKFTVVPLLHND